MHDRAIEKKPETKKSGLKNLLIFPICAIALVVGFKISERTMPDYFHPHDETQLTLEDYLAAIGPQPLYYKETSAGNYLSGQFAQRRKDWKTASDYLSKVLEKDNSDINLEKQAMVLAMGSGEINRAISLSRKVSANDPTNALATLFLIMDDFDRQDYSAALTSIKAVPENSLGSFITPVLEAWAHSGTDKFEISTMPLNSLYAYHALLIGQYTGNTEKALPYVEKSLTSGDVDPHDLEKIGDLYVAIDKPKKALELYNLIQSSGFTYAPLEQKIEALEDESKEKILSLIKTPKVQNPKDGAALVFLHMAEILYRDQSDDSALVFSNMALHLKPSLARSKVIIGSILARSDQKEAAIEYFTSIDKKDDLYEDAQIEAATLYEDLKQTDKAIAILDDLYKNKNNIEALIQIGHIHRANENNLEAIKIYDQAEQDIGTPLPREYWHLLYARGMAYEQIKEFEKSEKDLLAALEFQPNHPYILNYLGYSWADQGVNLEKSLDMIKRAVFLKPDDGYIADSLGWVLFRMNEFDKAIPHLERAVELLPYDPVINDHLGDAYWVNDRRIEARFQWERAYNHAKDDEIKMAIQDKLKNGLEPMPNAINDNHKIAAEKISETQATQKTDHETVQSPAQAPLEELAD